MTSIVVDHLQTKYKGSSIAYLYCNVGRQDQQTPESLFRSILKQLVWNQSPLPKSVKDLYYRHKDKQSPPELGEILDVLQSIISPDSRTFIIIDALDECQNHDGCRDNALSELFDLQAKTTVNVLATSRPMQEIEEKFEERSVLLEISARNEDVEKYLDSHMSRLPLLDEKNQDVLKETKEKFRREVKTNIVEVVNGV
jgi:hypothetical protein